MADFMTGLRRTHYCGSLRASDIGASVTVCGWVQRRRDLGQLIFIDLRDRTGIVQLAFDPLHIFGCKELSFLDIDGQTRFRRRGHPSARIPQSRHQRFQEIDRKEA